MTYRGISVALLVSAMTHGLILTRLVQDKAVVKTSNPDTLSFVVVKANNIVLNLSPNSKTLAKKTSISSSPSADTGRTVNFGSTNSLKINKNPIAELKSSYSESAGLDAIAIPSTTWILNTDSIFASQVVVLRLQLSIAADGSLDNYLVMSTTTSEAQTQYILKDFTATLFIPATKEGQPIASTMEVEIKVDNLDSSPDQNNEK